MIAIDLRRKYSTFAHMFYRGFPASRPAFQQPAIDPRRQRANMIRNQIRARGIDDPAVLTAMSNVPRHLFIPKALAAHAYEDSALPIGHGQTISQPYMVARMSQLLETSPGMRVLEIGSGCGYQAAVLAAMGCLVFGIERLRPIYQEAAARIRALGIRNVQFYNGDGTLGLPQAAPFDRIIVSAGGPEVPPPLLRQLDNDGVMLIPVGPERRKQRLLRLRKCGMRIVSEDLGAAMFVDLVGDHGW